MSDDNNPTENNANTSHARRGSFTQNTFNAIFGGRSNSIAGQPNSASTAAFPTPVNTAHGRRMSITTLGLSGVSPTQPSNMFLGRRASVSTAGSDSIDESAIEDDEGPTGRSLPATPYVRRLSFGAQALFNSRQPGGVSPGTAGRSPSTPKQPLETIDSGPRSKEALAAYARKASVSQIPQASKSTLARQSSDFSSNRPGEGLNWGEQFRSRAESTVTRPSFSTSPNASLHRSHSSVQERKKSVDMPAPPAAMPEAPRRPSIVMRRPDDVGERMLRGEFLP